MIRGLSRIFWKVGGLYDPILLAEVIGGIIFITTSSLTVDFVSYMQ